MSGVRSDRGSLFLPFPFSTLLVKLYIVLIGQIVISQSLKYPINEVHMHLLHKN